VERWAVKTLSDPDVGRIDTAVIPTSISALNELPAHCGSSDNRREYPEEFQVFELVGRIKLVRLEADRDFHIALIDAADPNQQLVIEVINPACSGAASSPFHQLLVESRAALERLLAATPQGLEGRLLRVQGVGFFDFDHRQTGRSKSCLELHPALRVELVE